MTHLLQALMLHFLETRVSAPDELCVGGFGFGISSITLKAWLIVSCPWRGFGSSAGAAPAARSAVSANLV